MRKRLTERGKINKIVNQKIKKSDQFSIKFSPYDKVKLKKI